jgi:hypothetical protein
MFRAKPRRPNPAETFSAGSSCKPHIAANRADHVRTVQSYPAKGNFSVKESAAIIAKNSLKRGINMYVYRRVGSDKAVFPWKPALAVTARSLHPEKDAFRLVPSLPTLLHHRSGSSTAGDPVLRPRDNRKTCDTHGAAMKMKKTGRAG